MIHTLNPTEAAALLAGGDVDLIDVREGHEFADGHLPGARLVPLGALRAEPRRYLVRDKVLLVCERGGRSANAARLAEGLGLAEIYNLEGGTRAWASAGLPIEVPPPRAPRPERPQEPAAPAEARPAAARPEARPDALGAAAPPEARTAAAPEPVEPALDAVVGQNLRELRTQRGLTLDATAQLTGLSRALLGQIELGRSAPSVGVVWKIARAFDVPFATLLASPGAVETRVLRRRQARRLVSPDGRFSSRALFPPVSAGQQQVEFYELRLAGHSREVAEPHQRGTRENLIVTAGRLELTIGADRHELDEGDAIVFGADVPHGYENPGGEECVMYLVMTYEGRGA